VGAKLSLNTSKEIQQSPQMPKNNQTSIKKILKNRGIAGVQAPLPGPGPAPKLNQRNINHQ